MANAKVKSTEAVSENARRAIAQRQSRPSRRPHVAAKLNSNVDVVMPNMSPLSDAAAEDKLISQLREYITGPEAKLAEARYEEFLNILSEQKESADTMFKRFDVNFRTAMAETEAQFSQLNDSLRALSSKMDAENQVGRQSLSHAIELVREEQASAVQKLAAAAEKNLAKLENETLKSLGEMTESFNVYANACSKQRDEDLASVMSTIQQLAADLRNEFTSRRQNDMSDIGMALTEVGKRLNEYSRN